MFQRLTIGKKVALVLWGACGLILGMTGLALAAHHYNTMEQRVRERLEPFASMIAVGVEAAVSFEDAVNAQDMLDTLRANPEILEARIVLANGKILARYPSDPTPPSRTSAVSTNGLFVGARRAELAQSITRDQRHLARLSMVMDLGSLRQQTLQLTLLFGACIFVMVAATLGQLSLLRRAISRPIQDLAGAIDTVREQHDYLHWDPPAGTDEVARLGQSFKEMMSAISLRESELKNLTRFQRAVLDHAAYAIISTDPEGLITGFNPAAERLLGYGAEEMIGQRNVLCFHEAEEVASRAAQLSEELGETIAPGFDVFVVRARRHLPNEYEWNFRRKDGARLPVLLSITALRDERERLIGFIGMGIDITEHKRAQQALQEREALWRAVFESAPIAIAINRLSDGVYLEINPAFEVANGWTAAEVLGKTSREIFRTDPTEGTEVGEQLRREGRITNRETRVRNKDGTFSQILYSAASLQYREERCCVSLAMDISERKRASEALIRSEAEVRRLKNYLSNIIDSMPAILVGLDTRDAVTQWNRQAESVTGVAAAEAIGRSIGDLMPDFAPWIQGLRGEIRRSGPAIFEKMLLVKNGERHFYDLMLYPLTAEGAEGAVLRIENASERVRIQELMIQTEKMMSVGGLAAGMAHEINNPLGIIAQAAQNIERRVSPDLPANLKVAEELRLDPRLMLAYLQKREIPQFIQDIRDAASRAARIVANMLQFSRKSEAVRKPMRLDEVLERTVELAANDYDLKKRYDFRGIQIVREYDASLPEVPLIGVEMEQVLLNLIRNSAQAMESNPRERPPRIVLRLSREPAYAVVEVSDNGPGMEEAVLRRVFEPFFTTKAPGVGTGLGLSVSYAIVTQNHKGMIAVDSTPGHGARFIVKLPLY